MMKPDFKNTALLAFENEFLSPPASGERWCFFNGQLLPRNEIFYPNGDFDLVFEQGFRRDFLILERAGFNASPHLDLDTHTHMDSVGIFVGRSRKVNEQNFLRAWSCAREGGLIFISGDKNTGVGSFRNWVKSLCHVEDSFSKHHAVCFWCRKSEELDIPSPDNDPAAGLFAGGEADKGSELLARFFSDRIKGKVADLGAGWGYLTDQLLAKSNKVESIDLYEADWASLETARKSLESQTSVPLNFHWIDIPSEFQKKPFEWVIMNPPFHHGLHGNRAADPGLGKAFIQTASSSLVQGGRLLMVANRNLPYEQTLEKFFRKVTNLADEGGFKVLEAVR